MKIHDVRGEGMTLRAAMALSIMGIDMNRLAVRREWVILIPEDRSLAVWVHKASRASAPIPDRERPRE